MLWLAGLMGLMAVGAVAFVDPLADNDEDDDFINPAETPTPANMSDDPIPPLTADIFAAENNFEPDYDPRGGDDAALLEPFTVSEAEQITLAAGTEGDDQFDGEDGNDRIRGFGGADTLLGGTGNDELRGDAGDDVLDGDDGNDTVHGHDGSDVMHGGDQDDILFGHNENDLIYGDAGDDALQGSAGNDSLHGGDGNDTVHGGLDNDTLIGGAGNDALFGGWGDDVLSGHMRAGTVGDNNSDTETGTNDDVDFLNGGGGNDSILVGAGDIVTAGDGADQIVLGDWLGAGEAAHITDYAAQDDNLVLVWDDSNSSTIEPRVTLASPADGADQTLVMMDGTLVATVNGHDLMPGDIALIPLSTATHVGLAAA